MSLVYSYREIDHRPLHEALEVLDNCPVLSVKTMCHFNKFKKKFDEEYKTFIDMARKIHDRYLIKAADGKMEGQPKFTDEEAKNREMGELWAQEFTIEVNPLKLSEVVIAELSPKQIRALDKFLIIDEAAANGPKLVKGS